MTWINPPPRFKLDNYNFYISLEESVKNSEIIKSFATNLYYKFTNLLLEYLTEEEYLDIRSHCFEFDLPNYKDLPTNISVNSYIDIDCTFNTFGLDRKETLRFILTDNNILKNRAAYSIGKNTILIQCKSKNNKISRQGIMDIYNIPDIIIHEIIHFINDIRSNSQGFNTSQKDLKQYYNDPREIHAFTQNLQHLLNDLLLNGYNFTIEDINTSDKLKNLLQNIKNTEYKYVTSNEVLNQLQGFIKYLTPKNFKRVLQDIVEYYIK